MELTPIQLWIIISRLFKYPPEFGTKFLWFVKLTPESGGLFLPLLLSDIMIYLSAALVFLHSNKKYGFWKSILFLSGSFLYTGMEENMWIYAGYQGSLGIPSFLTGTIIPATYYFNYYKALTWFFGAPMAACLGWYIIAYSMVYLVEKVFPDWDSETNNGLLKISLGAGLLAMSVDLFVDPIMVRNQSWFWLSSLEESLFIIGIPITNFIGWFLLIFLFSIYWNKMITYEEKWGREKTTIVFYLGLIGLLFGTIYLLALVGSILAPFFGINISIPGAGGLL
ncbi:MAG: carotenoid biosynthesis protein [Candidatus Helarchaeota archaeon]